MLDIFIASSSGTVTEQKNLNFFNKFFLTSETITCKKCNSKKTFFVLVVTMLRYVR